MNTPAPVTGTFNTFKVRCCYIATKIIIFVLYAVPLYEYANISSFISKVITVHKATTVSNDKSLSSISLVVFLNKSFIPVDRAEISILNRQQNSACSTSRNTGTLEHHGTFRNNRKNRNTPKKPETLPRKPRTPQENPEHPQENQEHPQKSPELPKKTRNTPKKTRNTPGKHRPPPRKPGTPQKMPGTPRKKTRNLKKQMARQYVTAHVSFSKLPPLIAHKIIWFDLHNLENIYKRHTGTIFFPASRFVMYP